MAPLLRDRYLRVGTPRPVQELHLGWALQEKGLPTPPHIGAAVYPAGPWYRGDLVTRYVPGSRDLAAVLFPGRPVPAEDAAAALELTGRLFRTLHDGGVVHPDLNLKNILIVDRRPSPEAQVLDLDGARLRGRVGDRARRRMIARFWRSARKWSARTATALDPAWLDAFEAGYDGGGDGWGRRGQ